MSEILYKKKSLRFSGCGLSKAVRLKEHSENRKSSRSELLNFRRNICHDVQDDSLLSEPEPPKEKAAAVKCVPKPLSRLEQLKKWKEEKEFKRKLELENKRKPFVAGKAKPVMGGSIMNSSTLFGAKNTSRIISSKNTSSLNVLKSTNRVIPKVNLPASSVPKPGTKNVNLPASCVAKPLSKIGTVSSIGQKSKPQNTSSLNVLKSTDRVIPKFASAASSVTVKDKPQIKTGIPKGAVSRLPSRNLPQVNQSMKTFDSRIPACKPSIQQKKENQPDGKSNIPDRIRKVEGRGPAPLAFKKAASKFLKPLQGMLPKPITSKDTVKKIVKNSETAAQSKIEPKRKSFAPENFNFKFAPTLQVLDLDLSVFEGIDFSRKTSTPVKEAPVPSPEIVRINSETKSRHLLSDISKCTDEHANESKSAATEVDTNTNIGAVFVSDISENEKKETVNNEIESKIVNAVAEVETCTTSCTEALAGERGKEAESGIQLIADETGESEEIKVKMDEPEKSEGSSAEEYENEIGDKNITRRSRILDRNSKVPEEITETEIESLLDVKPHELLNPRLCSIKEELECSSLDPTTPCFSPRRSLRLAKLAQNRTPVKDENPGPFTDHADLVKSFNQLQMTLSEEDLEPQLPANEMKAKKVSLLYTPPSSRYSLRKSVRGDLMLFS